MYETSNEQIHPGDDVYKACLCQYIVSILNYKSAAACGFDRISQLGELNIWLTIVGSTKVFRGYDAALHWRKAQKDASFINDSASLIIF